MANMSHCRFQNTLKDLRDCDEKLGDLDGDISQLSEEEQKAFRILIRICRRMSEDYPDIT